MNICYSPAGRSVLGKTVPEVLSTAIGRGRYSRERAQIFPTYDRPKLMKNISIFLAKTWRNSFQKNPNDLGLYYSKIFHKLNNFWTSKC